ncbi:hypothetical protein EYF80_041599 [Liparis tanakae]|uniref:Uncharacterized protein n=1 Tax=Liparis tanakae TaxID=230148 RepID=A0A4Z2G3N1_9TELE|nr:hypothetical protein EYF80_041599 [Liparis tanakae]
MALAITMATGYVALTDSFPVDVLMKSEPALLAALIRPPGANELPALAPQRRRTAPVARLSPPHP